MAWLLLLHSVAFLLLAVGLRVLLAYRQLGHSPVVLEREDSVARYLARTVLFLVALIALALVIALVRAPLAEAWGFTSLAVPSVRAAGLVSLVSALLIVIVAQAQMGASWRIGVDRQRKTELVTRGLFRLSRHPIYLGVHLYILGLFLCLPGILTLLVVVVGHFVVQLQARVEEAHLKSLHGATYDRYAAKVRRWL